VRLTAIFLACAVATASVTPAADKNAPAPLHVVLWPGSDQLSLTGQGIKASIDGQPTKVLRTRGPSDPLMILLVLDLCGDLAAVDPAREALASEIEHLSANTWVGLMRAQNGLQVLADPGPDRTPVIQGIQTLQVTGRAGMLETVEQVERLGQAILEKAQVRLAVIYVTDSNIYNYREDYTNPVINPSDSRDLSRRFPENLVREKTTRLAEALRGFDAPLCFVHVSYLRDPVNEAYQNGLHKMAEATGGTGLACHTPAEIPEAIHKMFQHVAGHWSLDLEMPAKVPRDFTVAIEAGDPGWQHRTHFTTRKN
jgi:hypothetical protein